MEIEQDGGRIRHVTRPPPSPPSSHSQCCQSCCLYTCYTRVLEAKGNSSGGRAMHHAYTIRTNLACCGRVNNCCGATCCKDSAVFDILDPSGRVVGHVQKLYGGGGCGACCRSMAHLNNYVLDFPKGATMSHRVLLLGGLMQMNYAYLEKSGGWAHACIYM